MSDISQILTLYRMMAERLEKSGRGARQAKVYHEMIEFMKDCASGEEAMVKIRGSKYYLAPSVAATEDMIIALRDAANDTGMKDLATVYDDKLAEIAADETAIYTSEYSERAKREKAAYLGTMEAFCFLFEDWSTLRMGNAKDRTAVNSTLGNMRTHMAALKKPSPDFRVLAADPAFRALIPLTDAAYGDFVREVPEVLAMGGFPEKTAPTVSEETFSREWAAVEASISEVEAAGRDYVSRTKEASVRATAPADVTGKYTFDNERIR
ncbi:MAG: hypothetical protein IK088_08150 [Lachnospiraceae bacterium]|nr:hypothetical protein [Lachnospiraceae bacterium]